MVSHVFLTRFNLPANDVEESIFSDSWLVDRVALFDRFTVPSVRAQDVDRLGWLVFLDEASPEWLRERMEALRAEGVLTPHYLSAALNWPDLRRWIRAEVERVGGTGHVLTSNLDNDDGIAVDYVSRMRAAVAGETQTPRVVYLTDGLILSGGRTYARRDRRNAFPAVHADTADPAFVTCWDGWHTDLDARMPAIRLTGAPAWLQVVHGVNVSNRVRGHLVDASDHRDLFPVLPPGTTAPSRREIAVDAFLQRPRREILDLARGNAAWAARRILGPHRFDALKSRIARRR